MAAWADGASLAATIAALAALSFVDSASAQVSMSSARLRAAQPNPSLPGTTSRPSNRDMRGAPRMGSPGMRGGMGGRGDPRPKQNVRIEPLHPRSPTSAAQPPMSGRGTPRWHGRQPHERRHGSALTTRGSIMRLRKAFIACVLTVVALAVTSSLDSVSAQQLISGAKVKNNSLTGRDMRSNSLTSADVRDIRGGDIRDGSLSTNRIFPGATSPPSNRDIRMAPSMSGRGMRGGGRVNGGMGRR